MKNYRKALIALFFAALFAFAAALTGCNTRSQSDATPDEPVMTTFSVSTSDEAQAISGLQALGIEPSALGIEPNILYDSHAVGFQLEMPDEGDTVAVIHTSEGDITIRFFAEQAPKAVTNFINLAKEGKYDNTTFHRVINEFIIQGGHSGTDPDARNGVSSYGGEFEDEFCDKLFNIRGAVSMVSSEKDSNGSQFFINQTTPEAFIANGGWTAYDDVWANIKTQLINYKDSNLLSAFIAENGDKFINTEIIPSEVKQLYVDNGGSPNLDGTYNAADRGNTVFAQVIDGMDVVDKIAASPTDESDAPLESIVITAIDITEYGASAAEEATDDAEITATEE